MTTSAAMPKPRSKNTCPYCHKRRGKLYEIQPMLYKEIKLLEEIAGLNIEQIQDMELGQFLVNFREYHLFQLKGLDDEDVHRQAQLLDYLFTAIREMIELTEKDRASRRNKEKSGIGDV